MLDFASIRSRTQHQWHPRKYVADLQERLCTILDRAVHKHRDSGFKFEGLVGHCRG